MRLVIDIPEDVYTRLFDNGIQDNEIAVDDVCEMARALRLGTPLPKHHGRLIDEKVIYNRIRPLVNNGQLDDIMLDMDYVLEADKEVQDEADSDWYTRRYD